jgi:hypothetical protein
MYISYAILWGQRPCNEGRKVYSEVQTMTERHGQPVWEISKSRGAVSLACCWD